MMIKNSFIKSVFPVTIISFVCSFLTPFSACFGADANWHVKEAPIRFKVGLTQKPNEKSGGYYILLPDGGILPTPFP
ncbi:MAG: hypothetical protein PHR77_12255, partial [Kiritimatiellae bacterium]|nr:hypothetical protein [Kiritimatiellia bacterium]